MRKIINKILQINTQHYLPKSMACEKARIRTNISVQIIKSPNGTIISVGGGISPKI